MTGGKKHLKRTLRVFSGIITILVIAVGVAAVLLAGYVFWDTNDVEVSAAKERFAVYSPEETKAGFDDLRAQNDDVIGWINVYGTNIDYPIVKAEDNWEYLTTDVFGNYSLTGSIFLDADNAENFSDFNSILYGHNMTPAVMFGALKDFKDKSFFEEHAYGDLYYGGSHHGLIFTRMITGDAYDQVLFTPGFTEKTDKQAYLDKLAALTLYQREDRAADVGTKDRIVLLSTCSNIETNIRDILVAKITNETFSDPFASAPKEKAERQRVEQQKGYQVFRFLKDYWWLLLIAVSAAILIAVFINRRKKAMKRMYETGKQRSKEE